jgi:hypothetical protein
MAVTTIILLTTAMDIRSSEKLAQVKSDLR